jgi:hypothetical protein
MTNDNRFWIGWLDLLALLLQLLSITITCNNSSQLVTLWDMFHFFLDYKHLPLWLTWFWFVSVTSSASLVCWLTLHSWTLKLSYEWTVWLLQYDWPTRMTLCEWIMCPFTTWCWQETEHSPEQFVCCIACIRCHRNMRHFQGNQSVVVSETCLVKRCPAMDYSSFQTFWHTRNRNVFSKALSNNGLYRLPGIMLQY